MVAPIAVTPMVYEYARSSRTSTPVPQIEVLKAVAPIADTPMVSEHARSSRTSTPVPQNRRGVSKRRVSFEKK